MNRAAPTSNHKLTILISPLCAAALFMALLLAGCGGDTSSTPNPTAPPIPTINVALWVANGTNVLEFAPSQLLIQGATSPVPQFILNGAFGAPQGVTFDAAGDLWVIDGGNLSSGGTIPPGLDEFTPAQLSALVTGPIGRVNSGFPGPAPTVTINSPVYFTFPQQAVFDSKGDLLVSDNGSNAVFEFTPAQLAAGGSNVIPTGRLLSSPAFTGPLGITFDSAGNLWVANNGTTTIFEFNAASVSNLPSPIFPYPGVGGPPMLPASVILSDDGQLSLQGPWALAFDAAGNLWSSNAATPFTVVEFAKANLTASGSPVPAVTIAPTQAAGLPSLISPNGIAFDNLGDLVAANSQAPFSIALFQNPQLIQPSARFDAHYTSIGPTGVPNVFFFGAATTLNAPAGVTFGPVH